MITCKLCKRAVTRTSLAMFEHVLTFHGLELLADPAKLARLANLSPADQRKLAADLGRSIARKFTYADKTK